MRWQALALGGLLFQVILFSAAAAGIVGAFGPPLYVASTVVVLSAVVRNVRQPWFWMVALGAGLNLLVIVANGGVMPVDPAALVAAGLAHPAGGAFSNTVVLSEAPFGLLGDRWATPSWVPFANVVSIGDLLIGLGAAAWLATTMWRGPSRGRDARIKVREATA